MVTIQFAAKEIETKAKAMRLAHRLANVPDQSHPADAYAWAWDHDCYWELWIDRAREALIIDRLAEASSDPVSCS